MSVLSERCARRWWSCWTLPRVFGDVGGVGKEESGLGRAQAAQQRRVGSTVMQVRYCQMVGSRFQKRSVRGQAEPVAGSSQRGGEVGVAVKMMGVSVMVRREKLGGELAAECSV